LRRDVIVEDIAPNIRYVHTNGLHSMTVTIPWEEREAFQEWCVVQGLKSIDELPTIDWGDNQQPSHSRYVFMLCGKDDVMVMKLAWSRYDMEPPSRF
jgi:hypothetical protein